MPKIRGKKQTVLTTANRLDLAITLFDEIAPVLEARFGASCVKAYGRNSVTMPDGSKWTVRAAKPSVGHGTSNDLIVADEIWDMSQLAIDGGLIPSMRARKSPLSAAGQRLALKPRPRFCAGVNRVCEPLTVVSDRRCTLPSGRRRPISTR
jgi:hypothetical protein